MTFASQLKAERQRLQMTQEQVARVLGVQLRSYSNHELGRQTPSHLHQEAALARLAKLQPSSKNGL